MQFPSDAKIIPLSDEIGLEDQDFPASKSSTFQEDLDLSNDRDRSAMEFGLSENWRPSNNIQKKWDAGSYKRIPNVAKLHRNRGNILYPISFPLRSNLNWLNGAKRNKNQGMKFSVTHNLDILRRRLLREIELRQREKTRQEVMMKNKGILGNVGK